MRNDLSGGIYLKQIRLLRHDEIECRVGTISEKGLSLLLYKDARADMKILDETFGCMNWQRSHQLIGNSLYCTVSVWDDDKKQWISKMDVGTESYTEKEKGQASDSFKRACVSIGIGRELYTAPFIWVSANKVNIQHKGDKLFTYDKFKLSDINYNENREIIGLAIVNQNGDVVYSSPEKTTQKSKVMQNNNIYEKANAINKELIRTGVALDTVLNRYGVSSIDDMSDDTYKSAMNSLRKTKGKNT